MSKSGIKNVGFTLVEMLVVITIIALLIGFMVTGISAARERAKKARAQAETAELTKAWSAYWKTYERWPGLFGYTDELGHAVYTNQEMNASAMAILQGQNSSENPQNLKFSNVAKEGAFEDPWGTPYRVDFAKSKTEGRDYYQTTVYFPNRKRYEYPYRNAKVQE